MPNQIYKSVFKTKPHHRSDLRMLLGKTYFTMKRYLYWFIQRKHFAGIKAPDRILRHEVFSHKTPLLRALGEDTMSLQYNKITNLHLTLPSINGLLLKPGETFSFWRLVGKPTKKKGYLEGMVLHNGKCSPGIGGGLCQLSNLIYWMTVHTPLTIVERWRHNYDVFPDVSRTQPFGSGATVVYNYVDLQICNHTEDDYQLMVWLDNDYLHGSWTVSYEIYESEHIIKSHWWGGYTRWNEIKRKVIDQVGNLIDDQLVCTNEAIMMYEPLLSTSETTQI